MPSVYYVLCTMPSRMYWLIYLSTENNNKKNSKNRNLPFYSPNHLQWFDEQLRQEKLYVYKLHAMGTTSFSSFSLYMMEWQRGIAAKKIIQSMRTQWLQYLYKVYQCPEWQNDAASPCRTINNPSLLHLQNITGKISSAEVSPMPLRLGAPGN